MIKLESVYKDPETVNVLYDLLKERTPSQSISHKEMPSFKDHKKFYDSMPYLSWGIIKNEENQIVGSIYLTHQREIGIFIFKKCQGFGYGSAAVRHLMDMWPGKFLWNVNPENTPSIKLVESLGGKLIQWTYELHS